MITVKKSKRSVISLLIMTLGLAITISLFVLVSHSSKESEKTASKSNARRSSTANNPGGYGWALSTGRESLPPEITIDEARKDVLLRFREPKYLPADSKLEVVFGGPGAAELVYDRGNEWIDIEERAKPDKPDYSSRANPPVKMAERILPNGTREVIPIKADAIGWRETPDGAREPYGIDTSSLIDIRGVKALYVEVRGVGTIRPGRQPRDVSPRDYGSLTFWLDGTEYVVWGSNISKGELIKIAESIID